MPLAFNTAEVLSVVLPFSFIVIAPACVPALMASKAALKVEYPVGPVVPNVAVTSRFPRIIGGPPTVQLTPPVNVPG